MELTVILLCAHAYTPDDHSTRTASQLTQREVSWFAQKLAVLMGVPAPLCLDVLLACRLEPCSAMQMLNHSALSQVGSAWVSCYSTEISRKGEGERELLSKQRRKLLWKQCPL